MSIFKLLDCVDTDNANLHIKMFGSGYVIVEADVLDENIQQYILATYDMSYKEYKEKQRINEQTVYKLIGTNPQTVYSYQS